MVMLKQCGQNGLFLAAFSSLVFAVCSLIAKQLSSVHPIQLCLYSFISIFILSAFLVLKNQEIILPKGCIHLILLRSVCGCLFFILSFYSVQLMPLGDASVLLYTTPLWTMILAFFFIKEPCKKSDVISVCVAMIGVIFVTQPDIIFGNDFSTDSDMDLSPHKYTLGASAAILASISEAMGNVILRKLKKINPSVILFNYSLFTIFICVFISLFIESFYTYTPNENILILILSCLTVVEQYLMGFALTLEHAGPVAIIQASDIIYGYILEILFYNEETSLLSFIGAAIVGAVVIKMATNRELGYPCKELIKV